jgi:hypothetical protein
LNLPAGVGAAIVGDGQFKAFRHIWRHLVVVQRAEVTFSPLQLVPSDR